MEIGECAVAFKDINKACPKDCYPLLEIDWKVESLSGFWLKFFLDAYKGYHQIQMVEKDEDKTTFFAGEGIFCYRKMPFGLKNAGATYQRLVDKVFSDQIGRNLEAYVDDMVIKIISKEDMLKDIQETFNRANPSKVKAVTDLEPPRTLKDVQSLNGKLAALRRFISKGAEKSLPFFTTLKSCTDKKTIQWTADAEEAF
ncbi:reverse transcriptase domain-containing protein [Tanacetum coccineum]